MIWLIARRAAIESLRDRLTVLMSLCFAVVLPVALLVGVVLPTADDDADLGVRLAFYLLLVGLMPAASAVGIAAGQFAGEKERGILTPLLASPASNVAIFGGKVLGAVLPPLLYALIGDLIFLLGVVSLLGPVRAATIPPPVGTAMVLLVPVMTTFAATVASLVSSRVRTYNAAQQLAGLALIPIWGALLGVAIKLPDWGTGALFGAVAALLLVDILLLLAGAVTWRREEVLSHA